MRYIEAEGLRLSVIGLGTWQFGTREWGYDNGYATDVATKLTPIARAEPIVAWQARGSARRVMQSIRPLVEDGLVAHVGVSRLSLDQWHKAERALRRPVLSDQVCFSLAGPAPLRDLVPYVAEPGRVVIA